MISMRRQKRDTCSKKTARTDTESPDPSPETGNSDVGDWYMVGILVAIVVCILHVVAIAIPWWNYSTRTSFGSVIKTNSGLWTECRKTTPHGGETESTCSRIAEPMDYILDTRSSNTVGVLLVGLGVIVSMVYRYWQTELHLLILIGGLVLNIAALLTWVTVVTYSVNYSQQLGHSPSQIRSAWYMALCSGLMYHVVSVLIVFKRYRGSEVRPQF